MTGKNFRPLRCRLLVALILVSPVSGVAAAAGSEEKDVRAIAFAYLEAHRGALGLTASDIDDVVVGDQHTARHSGTSHVYLRQRLHGIEVYNAILGLGIAKNGHVAHVADRFVSDLALNANGPTASISAIEAVERAAEDLDFEKPSDLRVLEDFGGADRSALLSNGGISLKNIPVKLVYQPLSNGIVRLAWNIEIDYLDQNNWWSVRVDAESGRVLDKNSFLAEEQYEVIPLPFESPAHSPMPPPADGRVIEVDPYLATTASPFGWHDTDGAPGPEFTITRGNNTHAYADTNANNQPDTGVNAEPDGGVGLDFSGGVVPLDFAMDPSTYTQASIANLFYWTNIAHDVLWNYGFDEASGNFQVNNYGNGGLGMDDVQAEGQDGSANCGANFATPADGARPRMQMFLCNNATPRRDGDFDHGVILHEYGHGVSNRLTGGPAAAGCLSNTEQMGEGWSDYLGIVMTQEPGDMGADARGIGTYLFGQPPDGPGIRLAPYSTDFSVNAFTYADVGAVSIPHGVGFIWATMLWQMTWSLIDAHGFNPDIYGDWTTGGNNLAIQLVMDGMKLQPCFPGFVDGRDAILAADDLLTGDGSGFSGENQCLIWDAFAVRGLGLSSNQGSSNAVNDSTPAFDKPAACSTIDAFQSERSICQGDTATYRIGVGDMFTSPPVTLSAASEPMGATTSFSPNPVSSVPGASDFEISNTGSVVPGTYDITVSGDDGVNMFETMVELNVFDAGPAGPDLIMPADTASDEPIQPTFTWSTVADAVTYTLEVDDDPGFGSIDYTASDIEGTSHMAAAELAYDTTYYWRVRGDNPCGPGVDSDVFSFTTAIFPGDCASGVTSLVSFEDHLESGAMGWTHSGTQDTWTLSGARTTSGANAWYALDPTTLSDQRLVSPSITLPFHPTTLTFQNYQDFETPNGDGRCWDAGILEVSTDNGVSWDQVPAEAMLTDPYDNIIWNDTPGNNPITNDYGPTDAWCAEMEDFVASVVDVGAWAGQTVRFAWRLGSDSLVGDEGWYIDDVRVSSCFDPLFANGFEEGDLSAWNRIVQRRTTSQGRRASSAPALGRRKL